MTPRQRERRTRVLVAVHELVEEGRVRDLQVKEIAERSGVSLAAIYRYFSSKEHLLAEALLDWAQRFTVRRRAATPGADDFAATVAARGGGLPPPPALRRAVPGGRRVRGTRSPWPRSAG